MKAYYYVHRRKSPAPPTVTHKTLQEAQTEAERLAAKFPGAVFEILKCVAISNVPTVKTFWMDGEEPPADAPPTWP